MSASFSVGRVALTVNDLDRVAAFYEQTVGLQPIQRDGTAATLGAGGRVLLELRQDRAARRHAASEAGLFHTAFLLPSRADLGRWVRHAAQHGVRLSGASDHGVSEALYLEDPEGNGVEIYADRPPAAWHRSGAQVQMVTQPLDLAALAHGAAEWTGVPDGTTVGHVHLQVGALAPAEAFYAGVLGLDITCRYPGGSFFAADGYHHHLAANIWNSRGAGPRTGPSTGLTELELRLDPARLAAVRARAGTAAGTVRDPWGTTIGLAAA